MNMNINPWIIQALVEYERDRIQRDMEQTRLEEEAIQAGRVVENIAKTRSLSDRFFAWAGKFTDTPPRSKSGYRANG